MTKKILLLLPILCWAHLLFCQVPSNPIGINPPSLKWQQIKTDKVQVIFPEGNEEEAQRVANVVHYLWERDNASIGEKKKKVYSLSLPCKSFSLLRAVLRLFLFFYFEFCHIRNKKEED